jgi:hypothetical protein
MDEVAGPLRRSNGRTPSQAMGGSSQRRRRYSARLTEAKTGKRRSTRSIRFSI